MRMPRARIGSVIPLLACLLAVTCLVTLSGCGGGGSGGSGSARVGQVTVLLADGPADAYENIYLTVHQIALLPVGTGAPVVLYSSATGEVIDLLDLRDEDLILTVASNVPAGRYRKVRLEVSDIITEGGPCDDLTTFLPSGRIDLEPRNEIIVEPDGAIALRVDIDANKSIQLHPAGNSGMCIFRPVVFVEAFPTASSERCTRSLVGTIDSIVVDGMSTTGFFLDLGAARGVLEVVLPAGFVSAFDTDGLPAATLDLATGQVVTVRGQLDDDGRLQALVIVQGQALEIDGRVDSVASPSEFVLAADPGSALVGDLDVRHYPETAVVAECESAMPSGIVAQRSVTVVGKFVQPAAELRAALVDLGPAQFHGQLMALAEVLDGTELQVVPDGEITPVTLLLPTGRALILEGDGAIENALLMQLLGCTPRGVRIALDLDQPGVALSAAIDADEMHGSVEAIDLTTRTLQVDGASVHVRPGATILALMGSNQQLVDLSDLALGDTVRIFGLQRCPGDSADFEGFVVLITDDLPQPTSQGCGLGFWKNHPSAWPAPYTPGTLFAEAFETDAFPGKTFMQVLQQGGGGVISLGRQIVAALLNAASPSVDYPLTPAQVIELFDADGVQDWQGVKAQVESYNEGHCPL